MKRKEFNPGVIDAAKARCVPKPRATVSILALARNPHVETANKVFQMARAGLTEPQMAALLEMDESELRLAYARTILKGQADAVWHISRSVLDTATGGANALDREQLTASLFWLKTKGGWVEPNVGGNVSKPGDPGTSQLTDTERRRKLARVLKFAGAAATRGLLSGVRVDPESGSSN